VSAFVGVCYGDNGARIWTRQQWLISSRT